MTTAARPSNAVLAEFGVSATHHEELRNLPGGRGLTWRAADTVLRPSAGDGETLWKANVLAHLPRSTEFRTSRPIPSASGAWTIDGWEAWRWLPGRTDETRVTDVLATAAAFHRAVADLDRPDFLDAADDPWARSDRIAWEEEDLPPVRTLQHLATAFHPVDAPAQIIHGDLLGNVMFAPGQSPAIIDWAPYWRPVGFADAIVWPTQHAGMDSIRPRCSGLQTREQKAASTSSAPSCSASRPSSSWASGMPRWSRATLPLSPQRSADRPTQRARLPWGVIWHIFSGQKPFTSNIRRGSSSTP